MRLQVKGRHVDVTDSLFQYAEPVGTLQVTDTLPTRADASSS